MDIKNQWDSASDWYNQNMGEQGDDMNKNIIRPLAFELLTDLADKTILDAGCGSGYLTSEIANKAKKVIGTDFAPNFISICQNKYKDQPNLEFKVQDITQTMSFEDNKFDIILSKMVLQYVPDIEIFAKESYRTLKTNGELLVIVDHPFHTQYYWAQSQAGKPSSKYPNLEDYFSIKPQNKLSLWGKVELTWYPRTISEYINSFISVGFSLETIKEVAEQKDAVKLPRILALNFKK